VVNDLDNILIARSLAGHRLAYVLTQWKINHCPVLSILVTDHEARWACRATVVIGIPGWSWRVWPGGWTTFRCLKSDGSNQLIKKVTATLTKGA